MAEETSLTDLRKLYEEWLEDNSEPIDLNIMRMMPMHGADGREIEYDERVVAYPTNITSEDLTANHAAGLPLYREKVIRCKDCRFLCRTSLRALNRPDHLTCRRFVDGGLGGRMEVYGEGFCAWAEEAE